MMTLTLILYAIGMGLNIVQIVLVGTKTLPVPEKCNHGHPVKGSGCIKVRAERRAGEILKVTEKHPGGWSHDETTPEPDKLSDIGITKSQSHRWQAIEEHHE